MGLKQIQKEYRETPNGEIIDGVIENTIYGFLGSILVVFISQGMDMAVLIGYLVYYFYLGKVVNRPKYVTSLGKFIVFPIPTSLGAFLGYKVALLASTYM